MYESLVILAAFVFIYSIVAGGLERTPVNGALVFMAFGLAIGPVGLNVPHMDVDAEALSWLAELTLALKLVAEAIGIGAGVGIALTLVSSFLIKQCADRGWITDSWRQLPVVALALSCFALAQHLGGSGFIACFVGGLLFDALVPKHKHKLLLAAEGTGDTLALVTWVVFGGAVVGQAIGGFSWQVVLYALLSLTVARMLPVFLVLAGTGIRTDEKLFMGWFGPRGLASIVFAVMAINAHLPGEDTITSVVVCTILFSIIAHGLSAIPAIAVLVGRLKRDGVSTGD